MVAGPERTVREDETFTSYRPVVKTGSGVGAGVGVAGVTGAGGTTGAAVMVNVPGTTVTV